MLEGRLNPVTYRDFYSRAADPGAFGVKIHAPRIDLVISVDSTVTGTVVQYNCTAHAISSAPYSG